MGKDEAESFYAIQSKLGALLKNSIAQDKLVVEKPSGTRVDFVEPQRKKNGNVHREHGLIATWRPKRQVPP